MQWVGFLIRFLLFQFLFASVVFLFSFLFLGPFFSIVAIVLAFAVQIVFWASSDRLIRRLVKPEKIVFEKTPLFIIETPVSEYFVSSSLFSKEKTIWITRGLFSTLGNDAAISLIARVKKEQNRWFTTWDTGLATLGLYWEKLLPKGQKTLIAWFFYFYVYSHLVFLSWFLSQKRNPISWICFLNKNSLASKAKTSSFSFIHKL